MPELAEPAGPPSRAFVAASYAVVLVLAVLVAVWGAFLVPFRLFGVPVPVSWGVVVAGNVALAVAAFRLLGLIGAAGPGLVWLAVALVLSLPRAEGDLVVLGSSAVSLIGLGHVLLGALASALAVGRLAGRDVRR